ncbi:MAG: hypothetical protein ACREYE_07630 [Gammaproteobacteria bacterium]
MEVPILQQDVVWSLGSLCAIHRVPFNPELLRRQFPAPSSLSQLVKAARDLGFKVAPKTVACQAIQALPLPCVALITGAPAANRSASSDAADPDPSHPRLALIVKADVNRLLYVEPGSQTPVLVSRSTFEKRYLGQVF